MKICILGIFLNGRYGLIVCQSYCTSSAVPRDARVQVDPHSRQHLVVMV